MLKDFYCVYPEITPTDSLVVTDEKQNVSDA